MLASRRLAASLLAVSAALLLTACDPGTPEPEPTTPVEEPGESAPPAEGEEEGPIPLEDLALDTDGLGSLRFGEAAEDDPELGMIHLDPAACTDEATGFDAGIVEGDPLAALWIANDAYRDADDRAYFGVNVEPGGVVTRIDLFTELIPTGEGIRIGDPAEVAIAAYPDARVYHGDLSDLVVVEGEAGILQLEIARETELFDTPYWGPAEVDTVRFINAAIAGTERFNVVASDNVAGVCPF